MFKLFFTIASFLTAFASENALRGESFSSFLDDGDEWKQFSNFQERLNDPIVKRNSDYTIKWKTFTDEKETCNYHLSKLFYQKGWSTYGDFK